MKKLKYENDAHFSKHALERLKKSYMRDEEVSPQERFRFVADKFSSNEEHADRIYNYASDLWLSFSTPILAYGKNKGSLGISCFEENTLVETENGLVKIKDLKIGDKVLSHDGKYHPVNNTKTQESTDTYHLVFNSESFYVTGNHLILTKEDGWVRVDELCQSNHTILSIHHHTEIRSMNFELQKINKKMTVVDIEVDESHTFTVGKSKMIVHNCYLPHVEDTKESLFKKSTESRILSTLGGGVGIGMSIRPRDDKSTGVMPHVKTYDADVLAYKQGSCYVEGTEVFTNRGFVEFKDLTHEHKVAMVDGERNIIFTDEYETVEQEYTGTVYNFKNQNFNITVTPNHRMVYSDLHYKNNSGERVIESELKITTAENLDEKRSALWFSTKQPQTSYFLTPIEKFYVALQADGFILKNVKNAIGFRFKKQRKIDALIEILENLGDSVSYSKNIIKGEITSFYIKVLDEKIVISKNLFECFDIDKITSDKAVSIIKECGFWDGSFYKNGKRGLTYSSTDKNNFKFYEHLGVISGWRFSSSERDRKHENRKTIYTIRFLENNNQYTYSFKKTSLMYSGKIYCAVVPTGMLIVREKNGAQIICGNTRRGATAIYLDVTHPEIMEFITIRDPFGGDANRKSLNIHHGINLTDDFMQRVETLSTKELTKAEIEEIDTWMTEHPSGVKRKESVKEIYEKILETRLQTGEPYLHFIDTSNKFLPKFQKDLGLTVKQSNLCFKGDTLVWTVNGGNLTIKELAESSAGKNEFLVYSASFKNGEWVKEISKAVAFQTGVLETIKVVLSNGKYFECTPEHKIALVDGSYEQARNLVAGQELVSIGEKIFVENIEFDETSTPVYDLTVENNHNFFIKFDKFDESNNSVLVHNCSEIIEPTGTDYMGVNRTAICCLASVNISKYDEWKDNTQFIQDIVEFLDNVIQSFIDDASKIDGLEDVVHSAKMERAIGIGAMGFHDYLQQKMIAFESPMAVGLNKRIFKFIKENADIATQRLAIERGACPDYLEWVKRCNPTDEEIAQNPPVRNSQTTSVAPNAASSVILNTSPSIEPYRANVYREEGDAGVFIRRNPNLVKLLEEKGMNTDETWSIITGDDGSVRSLKFLTDYEKDVFKTAIEIDQLWIIQHASDRQEYISQAQSLNLFFSPTVAIEYVAYIHLLAWKMGLKSIYYGRSDALTKVGKLGKSLEREKIAQLQNLVTSDEEICLACQ